MIELTKVLYTAVATAEGGRDGRAASQDGRLDVRVTPPPELGGPPEGTGTNPEQMFAAGYAACFHSALTLVAARMKLDAEDSTVTAKVGLGPAVGSPGYGLTVDLVATLPRIPDRDQAQAALERAHRVCPYSNAVQGNVEVSLTLG